jgi:hypothetical protein
MNLEFFKFLKILKHVHIYSKRFSNIEYVTRLKLLISKENFYEIIFLVTKLNSM